MSTSITEVIHFILYGGKLWLAETLVNLANGHEFAKFKPTKFYAQIDMKYNCNFEALGVSLA